MRVPWAMRKLVVMSQSKRRVIIVHNKHELFRLAYKIPLIGNTDLDLPIDNVRQEKHHRHFNKVMGRK